MDYFFYLSMALVAYSCVSLGLVLMKMGIDWMGWQGKRDGSFYKNLFLWLTGFIIMNIYGVPSAVALKRLPPHIVAACAGWGIVVLVFLSSWLLKEKLYRSDFIFSPVIVAGIFLLNYFEKTVDKETVFPAGLVLLGILPPLFFSMTFYKGFSLKAKTVLYAAVSGTSAGLMVVFLRLLVLEYGYKVALYFGSPYLYFYIGFALLSFIALQFACKCGPMMAIGPVQYAANIIYPALATLAVFSRLLDIIQVAAVALIVYSVTGILKKR